MERLQSPAELDQAPWSQGTQTRGSVASFTYSQRCLVYSEMIKPMSRNWRRPTLNRAGISTAGRVCCKTLMTLNCPPNPMAVSLSATKGKSSVYQTFYREPESNREF